MDYETNLHLFSAREEMSENIFDFILFDQTGQEKLRLPNTSWVIPSPDGQWIIAGTGQAWKVYTLNGVGQTEDEDGRTTWLDDSSGFYANSCDQDIRLYAKSNAWQPVKVYQGKCGTLFVIQKR